jgi:hypothetical protein
MDIGMGNWYRRDRRKTPMQSASESSIRVSCDGTGTLSKPKEQCSDLGGPFRQTTLTAIAQRRGYRSGRFLQMSSHPWIESIAQFPEVSLFRPED